MVFVCLILATTCYKSYNGYKIIRVNVNSEKETAILTSLESDDLLEVFSESRSGHVDVLIEGKNLGKCQQSFKAHGLTYQLITKNVGDEVQKERRRLLLKAPLGQGEFSYDSYHRLKVVYEHLESLAAKHSAKTQLLNLGETHEKRQIKAIRITTNVNAPESEDKPLIWLDGGIHAREWVSPATVMYIIDSFLGEQEKDKAEQITGILNKYQVVIAPCINPDGYEYSHEKERLWRKNRTPSGCKKNKHNWFGGCFTKLCHGVDGNRNWSADWGRVGVSADPCSEVYPGKAPFDQKNTKLVKDYLEPQKNKLKLFITIHSYSQLFLTPLGYTTDLPNNHEHHIKVGTAVVEAIEKRHGVVYKQMRAAELYPASGDSPDWAHDVLNVTDSYTYELRPDWDSWRVGFELPEEQILPTAEENVDGLLALIANIKHEDEEESEESNGESEDSNEESEDSSDESEDSNEESEDTSDESEDSNEESEDSNDESDDSNEESEDSNEESDTDGEN